MRIFLVAFFSLVSAAHAAAPVVVSGQGPDAHYKEWTLLLFLNGNNNLNRFGWDNLLDMEKIGSTDQVNIVVQWSDLESKKTKRLFITRSNDPKKISSPVVQDLGLVDMGDWRNLVDFIRWGVQNYPAKKYFVDVWAHGTGWHELAAQDKVRIGDVSKDDFTGNAITTEQLGLAMSEAARVMGHKVDVYGSDACMMGMIEIATEMAGSVSVYVGSEIDIPLYGWPYSRWLSRWVARPEADAAEVARMLHEEYVAFYRGPESLKKPATLSVFDLERTPEITAAIGQFGRELARVGVGQKKLVWEAMIQSLDITIDYTDLFDFANNLERYKVEGLASAIAAMRDAASRFVLANGSTAKLEGRAHGISIWLPEQKRWWDKHAKRYKGLRFSLETRWEESVLPLVREQ